MHKSLIKGDDRINDWFYAVGAISNQLQAIPGPRDIMTQEVQLWAKQDC